MKRVERRMEEEVGQLRERLEKWDNGGKAGGDSGGRSEATGVKGLEGESAGVFRAVVLTDSNGRDIGPADIKAHIPKD